MVEETPARATDLPVEEAPSEAEVEWARIDDSSIYSASELLPSYRRFFGQNMLVNGLYKISQAITPSYQADGYGETSAVVPAQLIRIGFVTIRIEKDFVGNVISVH